MQPDRDDRRTPLHSARSSLLVLAFGLAVLAFLVAIDRPHWFVVKPATGTAAAMFYAADGSRDAGAGADGSVRR